MLKREEVARDLWRPDVVLWAGRARTSCITVAARQAVQSGRCLHSDRYEEGWNAEGAKDVMWQHFKMQVPQVTRLLERIENLAHVGAVRPRAVKNGRTAASPCSAMPRTRCCNISAGRLHGDEDAVVLAEEKMAGEAPMTCGRVPGLPTGALSAHRAHADHGRVYGEFYHARGVTAELRDMAVGGRTVEPEL